MEKKNITGINLAARIISIAFALFISIFSLDVFSENYGFPKIVLALLIHLIPTFLVFLVLLLSWRREWIGGLVYIGLGILYIISGKGSMNWTANLLIDGPLFILGILFFIAWYQKRNTLTQ